MAAAWEYLQKLKTVDLFLFQDVRADSNLAQLLMSGTKKGWKQDVFSRVIRLDRFAGWDEYMGSLPKRMMSDQKRQWRRIAAIGEPARFDIVTSKKELHETLDWVLHHKLAWLQASGKNDHTFASSEYVDFIHDVVENASECGFLMFGKVCVGDHVISSGFGYKNRTEFIIHNLTYDAEWQNYSPGRLLLENMIKWCIDNGVTLFDFMPGEEGYKGQWGNDEFWVTDYIIPVTLRGSAIIGWHASGFSARLEQNWLKSAFHHLPIAVRKRLVSTMLEQFIVSRNR